MQIQNRSRDYNPPKSQMTAKRFRMALSEALATLQMADHLTEVVPIDPFAMRGALRLAISTLEDALRSNGTGL